MNLQHLHSISFGNYGAPKAVIFVITRAINGVLRAAIRKKNRKMRIGPDLTP